MSDEVNVQEWLDTAKRSMALRFVCRCGKMIVEPSEGCEWHAARIEQANELRGRLGSIEF